MINKLYLKTGTSPRRGLLEKFNALPHPHSESQKWWSSALRSSMVQCRIPLKGQCQKIFDFSFSTWIISPKPLIIPRKMIHKKNLKQKISWHCPFKEKEQSTTVCSFLADWWCIYSSDWYVHFFSEWCMHFRFDLCVFLSDWCKHFFSTCPCISSLIGVCISSLIMYAVFSHLCVHFFHL